MRVEGAATGLSIAALVAASKGFRIVIVAERQSLMSLSVARVGGRPGPLRRSTAVWRRQGLHGGVVETTVGVAREELVAVDEPRQRPGLGAQRVDDVAVVDDMARRLSP